MSGLGIADERGNLVERALFEVEVQEHLWNT
jgi:hypothetical protein